MSIEKYKEKIAILKKLASLHPDLDSDHLDAICDAYGWDIEVVEKALDENFCGVWYEWEDYVRFELDAVFSPQMPKEAWKKLSPFIDWREYGAILDDERLSIPNPSGGELAIFNY